MYLPSSMNNEQQNKNTGLPTDSVLDDVKIKF
jgi:hypothetical protein